ncbi:hypothetical protein GH714_043447 [Hevea brasiliensis]|uniref:Core domain-containing protein n=1 Tax=Hevea brasiliensis TaxID=3981 RepID=A0A6A6K1D3_HEVBR|nr:hypothetical protein GH714_043447 [Hevea brasiliensis]
MASQFLAAAAEKFGPAIRRQALTLTDARLLEYAIYCSSANGLTSSSVSRLAAAMAYPIPSITLKAYEPTDKDEKGKFDELVEEKGVNILIDPKALMHVIGTKMDFVDDKLRSEFIFINPNSKGQCGCGESFMTTTTAGAAKQGSSR